MFSFIASPVSFFETMVCLIIKLKYNSHLKIDCDPDRVSCPHHKETLHLVVCESWPHCSGDQINK